MSAFGSKADIAKLLPNHAEQDERGSFKLPGARTLDWLAFHAVDIEPVSGLILRNLGIFQIPSGDFQPAAALKTGICNSETIV